MIFQCISSKTPKHQIHKITRFSKWSTTLKNLESPFRFPFNWCYIWTSKGFTSWTIPSFCGFALHLLNLSEEVIVNRSLWFFSDVLKCVHWKCLLFWILFVFVENKQRFNLLFESKCLKAIRFQLFSSFAIAFILILRVLNSAGRFSDFFKKGKSICNANLIIIYIHYYVMLIF